MWYQVSEFHVHMQLLTLKQGIIRLQMQLPPLMTVYFMGTTCLLTQVPAVGIQLSNAS